MNAVKPLLVFLLLLAAIPLALAQPPSLSEAKAEGLVGERMDGLVGVVAEDPSRAVQDLVERVNAQRMEEYRGIAEETNASLEAVRARAARQLIQNLPEGQYFRDAAGRWRQK